MVCLGVQRAGFALLTPCTYMGGSTDNMHAVGVGTDISTPSAQALKCYNHCTI